jgi:hypothetical protein
MDVKQAGGPRARVPTELKCYSSSDQNGFLVRACSDQMAILLGFLAEGSMAIEREVFRSSPLKKNSGSLPLF